MCSPIWWIARLTNLITYRFLPRASSMHEPCAPLHRVGFGKRLSPFYHKWSLRRFTYEDLVTTSPSSKLQDSNKFLKSNHSRVNTLWSPLLVFTDVLSPRSSSQNSISRSDGRCVQRAGTYSRCINDTSVQGIPCSSAIIAKHYPHHEIVSEISCSYL